MTIDAEVKVERPLLRYYGGKWRLATWIIARFPPHECYVEPYGGAGSVLVRKEPSRFEVYNDLCGDVVTFFRVLRTRPRELLRALRYTPYAREEFDLSYETSGDDVERARRFFVMAWQGYGGPRKERLTGWKIQKRSWHSGRADQLTEWQQAKEVCRAARRFGNVQIEQDDALRIIRRFDTPRTLFYCDPPYTPRIRGTCVGANAPITTNSARTITFTWRTCCGRSRARPSSAPIRTRCMTNCSRAGSAWRKPRKR
jgi:DNA adenine methylase